MEALSCTEEELFQSTHSLRSATRCSCAACPVFPVSIHALLTECDKAEERNCRRAESFNPRTPYGVRRRPAPAWCLPRRFQSTRSLRSATDYGFRVQLEYDVSIHALLTECDPGWPRSTGNWTGFNPRTPYGVRLRYQLNLTETRQFQSTHSLRSATRTMKRILENISFQSTHSLRSATHNGNSSKARALVSIHALLTECDWKPTRPWPTATGFNPRTPYGVRPALRGYRRRNDGFQSTHSLRSATREAWRKQIEQLVSIHALLTECDHPCYKRTRR